MEAFVLRFNGSNNFPRNCMCDLSTLTFNCNHLTTDNNGVYTIHIIINTTLNNTPEWCSNNVTIIVQSKAYIYIHVYIYIYIYIYTHTHTHIYICIAR